MFIGSPTILKKEIDSTVYILFPQHIRQLLQIDIIISKLSSHNRQFHN